jgi:quinol monooxygenase YgiN
MNEIPVVAIIKAKPGKAKLLEEVLSGLVAPTHHEAGCVRYALHRSVDDPALFVFVEKWTSAEALQKHLGAPHVAAAFTRKEELIAEFRVISLAALGGGEPAKSSF